MCECGGNNNNFCFVFLILFARVFFVRLRTRIIVDQSSGCVIREWARKTQRYFTVWFFGSHNENNNNRYHISGRGGVKHWIHAKQMCLLYEKWSRPIVEQMMLTLSFKCGQWHGAMMFVCNKHVTENRSSARKKCKTWQLNAPNEINKFLWMTLQAALTSHPLDIFFIGPAVV